MFVDPLALWGAITGTVGLFIAGRREHQASKRDINVKPGVNLNISRDEPETITQAWAMVTFFNQGGRDLAVERVGFRFYTGERKEEELHLWEFDAAVWLADPIPVPVDGPTQKGTPRSDHS